MDSFSSREGGRILEALIAAVRDNKQKLSDLDGAIGDGDHGINMSKGFSLAREELDSEPGDLSHGLQVVSKILMGSIGGAMGPLYGMFFKGLARGCSGAGQIDKGVFARMLASGLSSVLRISQAKVGDKSLMDALVPAVEAYQSALDGGKEFREALEAMAGAAEKGRDSTREMVARIGRASRLGERSKGTQDPGATSCALILRSLAESMKELLEGPRS
jgi:dihydroxyacetone kinase-like protein